MNAFNFARHFSEVRCHFPSSLTALPGILILAAAESLMLSNLVATSPVEAADIHHGEPADPLAHLWPHVLPVVHSSSSTLSVLFSSVGESG